MHTFSPQEVMNIQQMINNIIEQDEGGWLLTADKNDNDGGWTFAGVTRKTWEFYTKQTVPYEQITDMAKFDLQNAQDTVKTIYFKQFYMPLFDKVSPQIIKQCHLSCAINCTVPVASIAMLSSLGSHDAFIKSWTNYYLDLVINNAIAWKEYADYVDKTVPQDPRTSYVPKKPTTLRAKYIKGWMNRINRYRTPIGGMV